MAQPNGAAKVPAYLAIRYGSEFVVKSHQNGVESATRDVGASVAKEVVAAGASEAVVEQASKRLPVEALLMDLRAQTEPFQDPQNEQWKVRWVTL